MVHHRDGVGGAKEGNKHSGSKSVALYELEPVSERADSGHKSISHLTFEAASVSGTSAKVLWGLEDGRWHLVSCRECDID
jgi:hypothetical protein